MVFISGTGASNKDNIDVVTKFILIGVTTSASLVVVIMDWFMKSTSIFVSTSGIFLDGGISNMVVEVEVVWGYGLCDIGDTMDVGGGFSSIMGVLV